MIACARPTTPSYNSAGVVTAWLGEGAVLNAKTLSR
jgi:hypothetical protein